MSRRDFSDCMIGEGSKVDGTIDAPGMVRIDGEFSGDIISASSVIISKCRSSCSYKCSAARGRRHILR